MILRTFLFLILTLFTASCTIQTNSSRGSSETPPPGETIPGQTVVTSVSIVNHLLTIQGSHLDTVTQISIEGVSQTFQINAQSTNEIQASVSSALKLVAQKSYNLVLSSASAQTIAPITLTLDTLGAGEGQVLQFNATSQAWEPGDLNGLTFKGNWDASVNSPDLTGLSVASGDYFIVVSNGSTNLSGITSWNTGDWAIYSSEGWQKIANADTVASFKNRVGAVSPVEGDYTLDLLGDVTISGTPSTGSVLKWNGSTWAPGTDETGTGTVSGDSLSVSGGGSVGGNLGVGTSTPSANLHVVGSEPSILLQSSTNTAGTGLRVDNSSTTYGAFFGVGSATGKGTVTGASSSDAIIGHSDSAKTHLVSNNQIGLTVTPAGDVGIGTVDPSAKLEVSGAITASGAMKIGTTSATCDSTTAGTFRWTGTAAQVCAGNIWRTLTENVTPSTLSAPTNGASNESLFPTLSWTEGTNATSFKVWVADNAFFTSPIASGVAPSSGSSGTSHIPADLAHGITYYWYIESCNSSGGIQDCGAASEVRQLTTENTPANGCPSGYVKVPLDGAVGTTADFCVAKYEMKSVSGRAISQASSSPYVSINATNSYTKCSELGTGYHLITNAEWMTIARNIESTASNWSDGSVGSGMINRGHSDSTSALAITDTADPYNGTGNNSGEVAGSGWEQKRTHTLSNGETIWDFAGNVWEWVDWDGSTSGFDQGPTSCSASWKEFSDAYTCSLTSSPDQYKPSGAYTSANGVGQWYGGGGGAAIRGGRWADGADAGVFALNLNYAPSSANTVIGFRCAFSP